MDIYIGILETLFGGLRSLAEQIYVQFFKLGRRKGL